MPDWTKTVSSACIDSSGPPYMGIDDDRSDDFRISYQMPSAGVMMECDTMVPLLVTP